LAPQKYRGKRCEPWMVEEVADKVAELKGLSIDEVKKLALENSLRVFDRMKII